ncbi:integrase domain-containing protein [Vibrio hannami]|uniref:integrase domain-containing protein n=1 Tax=Vibrio hannami TaxID=2717094 RepID=UPI00240F5430|nr:integrase domain-containing protein [Vibrio hannami]MDG3084728.1 integrase domain-containing protein [Vibrio hannami]
MKKGISSTCRQERQNPNSRNCGLRSRDINQAGKNAMWEKFNAGQVGFQTVIEQSTRFTQFSGFIRENFNVGDIRNITRDHVIQYAEQLNAKIVADDISVKTGHDYLSAVNSILSQAIGNASLRVTGSEAGLPSRSGVATQNKAITNTEHNNIKSQLSERHAIMSDMQRAFGLRFEEASKANPSVMLKEALQKQAITVSEGTKGGQSREVPIRSQVQIDILRTASVFQGNHHSMIPNGQTYAQFHSQSYREFGRLSYHTHSERHSYAQQSYSNHIQQKTGVQNILCPVAAGISHGTQHINYIAEKAGLTVENAKALDNYARIQVAEELGHHRMDITNSYLG